MKLDNFRLIVEVEQRRALWDSTMSKRLRRDLASLQWVEVANVMQMDVAACKKRFKGLRDSYRAEIRKIQQRRICSSNWTFFRALEFLRDIFDPDKMVPFSPQSFHIEDDCPDPDDQHKLDDFTFDVDNDDSFDFEIMGDIFKREPAEPLKNDSNSGVSDDKVHNDIFSSSVSKNISDLETSPILLSPILPIAPPAKRARRQKSTDRPYQNGLTNEAHSLSEPPVLDKSSKDDPDYNFLVSLLPHVKSLSSMSNMKFRAEVSRMLMDLNQQDRQSTQREFDIATRTPSMPKLTPAPAPNYNHQDESQSASKYFANNHSNGSTLGFTSVIECDVKIENEPLLEGFVS